MRTAHKVDDNQSKIVEGLRSIGATVQLLSGVGKGCPDLLVGIFKRNYCFEIKNPDQPKSTQALTSEEAIWHNEWKGQIAIVRTVEEALEAIK
jgi:hypothetical protein